MMRALIVTVAGFLFFSTGREVSAEVTAEPSDGGVIVKINGQLFAEYLKGPKHQPCVWPIIGPTGKPMTRAYPIGPEVSGESDDHPHHHSLWFTHGEVNGLDFWTGRSSGQVRGRETRAQRGGNQGSRIVHRDFVEVTNNGSQAKIVARNDWMNDDEKVCQDERMLVFSTDGDNRWIDFTVTVKATEGDVTFGDTKEGSFAIRVPDTMKVDAKLGGRIVNREGLTNDDAWGMPSRWVDYSGPVDGETVGIAMLSHPKSFRPVCRWHVRTYGLFAANPFGQRDFPEPGLKQGEVTVRKGDDLTLRYRVLFHRGDEKQANMEEAYRAFAGEP